MKKFLTTSVILLALVCGALGAFVPSAQAVDGPLLPLPGELGADIVPPRTPAPSSLGPVSATPAPTGKVEAEAIVNFKSSDTNTAFGTIMTAIMGLFAWLVGVAAIILDNAVYMTVVTMGQYVNDLSAIGITWRILRDVGNILLIFGFIAIGISIILNTEKLGYGKKALPMLLVAAVFLNFSLFISEAIIDTGNLFATQFYTQINGGQPAGSKEFAPGEVAKEGISNKIMGQLGMATIYGNAITNQNVFKAESPWFIGFMGILLFLVLAFVMFSLAFILIARFVILVFLIIISPVAFAGYAIPKLQSSASKWWSELIEQTITAPVLLLLLYIALRVITDTAFLNGSCAATDGDCTSSWLGWIGGNDVPGFAGVMLSFLIAMGLLLGVVILSKKLSAFGAAGATKLAGKLSFGAAAWAGRGAVGTLIGRGLLGNRLIKRGAVSDNKLIRYSSRIASFTGKRLQNRTYDVRNAPVLGTALGRLNVDAGSASSLTAKQLQEKQYGVKPIEEFFRESALEHDKAAADLDRKKKLKEASATYGPGATPQQTAAAEAARKELKNMSTNELAALGDIRKGINSLVWNLSPAAFSDLMKSEKLSGAEKKEIRENWDKQFSNSSNTAEAMIKRLSTSEIAALSGSNLTNANTMPLLDPSALEAIRRKGDLSTAERNKIYIARRADPAFGAYLAADPSGARESYWNV